MRMRSLVRALAWLLGFGVLALALAVGGLIAAIAWNARSGEPMLVTRTEARRPDRSTLQRESARQQAARAAVGESRPSQILFGDLHVHTTYSADSFLQGLSIRGREGRRPPADACDFARFCSQLDFWSINDHAESLTPEHWRATIDAVRECNALAGDPADPDLVSFLGWEWTQARLEPETHYGHKNVVLLGTDDDEIPARPIAADAGAPWTFLAMGIIGPWTSSLRFSEFASFHRYFMDVTRVEDCPTGVPVRELPPDCRESAGTPAELFAKLDDWGHEALVIPHGLSWGITNPSGARLDVQIAQHAPRWQRLVEVYSGHGNSEVFADFERPSRGADGRWNCPAGNDAIELCCEVAPALARARCEEPGSAACERSVDAAVQRAASSDAGMLSPLPAVPGTRLADWGECGQLRASFLPSFQYRPRQSAQYALALASADGEPVEQRFRWGFIASSDTHRSRPGTGYKEFARQIMTDGVPYPIPSDLFDERAGSYYYTGGLAAVHAPARDRRSIFDALARRETYGTSGDRILLWFDLLNGDTASPMGSEVARGALRGAPRFSVRAVGAARQKPGCPAFVHAALPAERIASLCLAECHNPAEERKRIVRLEVVRIRASADPTNPVAARIEDPWRVFSCAGDAAGCTAEFEDPEFAGPGFDDTGSGDAGSDPSGRLAAPGEVAYYVRAIQEPSDAVNGDPLRCQRDETGRCIASSPCGTAPGGLPEDCRAAVGERAWSSPIWITATTQAEDNRR